MQFIGAIRSGVFVTALGLAACAGAERSLPPAKVAAQALAADAKEPERDVFDGLSLSADQRKAIDALRAKLGAELLGVDDARHVLVDAVANAIAEGKLDHTKVDPAARLFVDAVEAARPAMLDDLNDLYRILTPKQRIALANQSGARKDDQDDKPKDKKDRAGRVLEALHLSLSQTVAIAAALSALSDRSDDVAELKTELDAAAQAFQSDSFDARNLAIAKAPIAQIVLDQGFAALDLILPELDDYQHRVLAELARQMLDPKPMGPNHATAQ